jgi:hypothetical protein
MPGSILFWQVFKQLSNQNIWLLLLLSILFILLRFLPLVVTFLGFPFQTLSRNSPGYRLAWWSWKLLAYMNIQENTILHLNCVNFVWSSKKWFGPVKVLPLLDQMSSEVQGTFVIVLHDLIEVFTERLVPIDLLHIPDLILKLYVFP